MVIDLEKKVKERKRIWGERKKKLEVGSGQTTKEIQPEKEKEWKEKGNKKRQSCVRERKTRKGTVRDRKEHKERQIWRRKQEARQSWRE